MSFSRTLRCLSTACLTLVCVSLAYGQSATTGAIAGVARDATGAVLPGVTVEVASPALIEKVRSAVTDAQGNYRIVDLRPGTYSVTFTLPGFSTFKREGIELTTGFTAAVNADMRVGGVQETVTVTGASPVVDIQNVRTQTVIANEVMNALPTGKTNQAFATLTLGAVAVAPSRDGGQADVGGNKGEQSVSFAIHGGRALDSKQLMDGMSIQIMDVTGGGYVKIYKINQVAVEETTIGISGMSAESDTGGVQMNFVPKDGGNRFSTFGSAEYTNDDLQSSNVTDELRARNVRTPAITKKVYDWGVGLGGRIVQDRVWFYTAHRAWGTEDAPPGAFWNASPNKLFYVPDLDRPGIQNLRQRDHGVRLTWQASPKNKVAATYHYQNNCFCLQRVSATLAPEATTSQFFSPTNVGQVTWNSPVTNRLLFEAGATFHWLTTHPRLAEGVSLDDIAVQDLSTGRTYGSTTFSGSVTSLSLNDRGHNPGGQNNQRFSISYVTGAHALKGGLQLQQAKRDVLTVVNNSALSYQFRLGRPVQLTQYATPIGGITSLRSVGVFLQDQWTIDRLTLNLGARFHYFNSTGDETDLPAGLFVPARHFDRVDDVPNWRDFDPRVGAAYDVFGNGKTAVKASLGRYVLSQGLGIANANHPAFATVTTTSRTWNDANSNFVPDCNLQDLTANGECAAVSNNRFGTPTVTTRWSQDVLEGFGKRDYNWQTAAMIQQELYPGVALNAGYFRTWYGNFTVTDNLAVTPADYSEYCVTTPVDARLPGGGGQRLCGLYDLNPSRFGQVDNLVTHSADFGKQEDVFNGVDVGVNARLGGGAFVQGGVSVGQQKTNNCEVFVDSPQGARPGFCDVTPPWSAGTQFKASGMSPLPWGFQAAMTFINLPGAPIEASLVVPNAQVAPSLGRNLSGCPAAGVCTATRSVPIIPLQTEFEERLTQMDLRLSRHFRVGGARLQAMFDIYNVFNAATILVVNPAYGANWLQPTFTLSPRTFKFGAQVDF